MTKFYIFKFWCAIKKSQVVGETSNVYCAVVVGVDVEGGLCCRWPGTRVINRPRHKGWRRLPLICPDSQIWLIVVRMLLGDSGQTPPGWRGAIEPLQSVQLSKNKGISTSSTPTTSRTPIHGADRHIHHSNFAMANIKHKIINSL